MPSFTLSSLADRAGFTVPADAADLAITGIQSLEDAGPGDLSFLGNTRYLRQCRESKASAILVPPDFCESISALPIPVENPSLVFGRVIECFRPAEPASEPGIHPSAIVDPSAIVASDACIGAGVVIEAGARIGAGTVLKPQVYVGRCVELGDHCLIYPGVVIREHARIGNRVILHPGVVVGSDGFGFEMVNGRHQKIAQVGTVRIDDDVEIGANTTIDRARFGETWIQEGAKIDNLVQIAHNVVIGKHAIAVSQVGISGSSKVGQYSVLAGQVGVVGHIKIGNQAVVAAQSGVSKDVPDGATMLGSPAVPIRKSKEQIALVSRLPKLVERVKRLEEKLNES